jgi:Putative MetA-pathway of phenol degradation
VRPITRVGVFCMSAFAAFDVSANCGSAFCSINTNSEIQHESLEPGLSLNLRYEFVDLDQPREGTKNVGAQGEPGEHDEIETKNHRIVLGLDYVIDKHWGVGVQIPYIKRKHVHIHNPDEDGIAAGEEAEREEWSFSGVGDVRAIGRYQFNLGGNVAGIHVGAKFPTGKRNGTNDAGEEAERTLQLGTGSTDLIAGVFAKGGVGETQLSWFFQTQWQHAIATKDDFRPGDEITADFGLRYAITESFAANVQLNTRYKRRDAGANAEPDESGGKYIHVSPGLSYAFGKGVEIYAYLQVPLYQNVNGIQLTQSMSYLAGASFRF